ncbi:hypothetical protein NGRA_2689 [Nosema granulosis]|uniref:Uncharacterized protein n=1 Tax=Nosema granulosis TaxID=83296 RepID=A0A9P6GXL4_9MICR|nr:hypothetical protein NGRA_2689 [Nosema granulosis]
MLLLVVLISYVLACSRRHRRCGSIPKKHNSYPCPSERPCPLRVCDSSKIIGCYLDRCCKVDYCDIKVVEGECYPQNQVSLKEYVRKTMMIIKNNLKNISCEAETTMKRTLTIIHNQIGGDKNTLALFTSSALHNTSYLTIFRAASRDKYCSRGLLMIKDLFNYQKLTKVSGIDFVLCPEKLEQQSKDVIEAQVFFFKWIMRSYKYTFVNMMKTLNPDEYRVYAESNGTIKNDRWRNRESLYNYMMCVY